MYKGSLQKFTVGIQELIILIEEIACCQCIKPLLDRPVLFLTVIVFFIVINPPAVHVCNVIHLSI